MRLLLTKVLRALVLGGLWFFLSFFGGGCATTTAEKRLAEFQSALTIPPGSVKSPLAVFIAAEDMGSQLPDEGSIALALLPLVPYATVEVTPAILANGAVEPQMVKGLQQTPGSLTFPETLASTLAHALKNSGTAVNAQWGKPGDPRANTADAYIAVSVDAARHKERMYTYGMSFLLAGYPWLLGAPALGSWLAAKGTVSVFLRGQPAAVVPFDFEEGGLGGVYYGWRRWVDMGWTATLQAFVDRVVPQVGEVLARATIPPLGVPPPTVSQPAALPAPPVVSQPAMRPAGGPRTALVVGNAAYRQVPSLRNPVNDATALAAALRNLGFDVDLLTDADRAQMLANIAALGRRLQTQGGVGLFFFAGHGVQVKGENFLVPIDAPSDSDTLEYNMVPVQQVLDGMEEARNEVNILILDACRDNPFASRTRTMRRGLAGISSPPTGSVVAFAASRDQTASDGDGTYGLYTSSLLRYIGTPGLPVEQFFKNVRNEVANATQGKQVPEEWTKLRRDFSFAPLR